MRTFDEISADVSIAASKSDVATLLRLAEELDELSSPEATARAHGARGVACFFTSDHPAALDHYNDAIAIYEGLGDRSGVARMISNVGSIHVEAGNYSAALECFHRALATHEELGNRTSMAVAHMGIANAHRDIGGYPSALEHYHRCLAMYVEQGDRNGVARATSGIGNVLLDTGDYPSALDHLHRALSVHEEVGDRRGEASVNNNMGIIHKSADNHSAALDCYQRALELYEELGDSRSVASIISNIGSVHGSMGNQQSALEYFGRAISLFEELGDLIGIAGSTGNIASALVKSGMYSEAQALLHTMDAMQIDFPRITLLREQTRATIQQQQGDLDGSARTLHAALDLARTHTLVAEQAEVHRSLRDLALIQNDFAGYVEHNKEFTRITEEVNGKDTATRLAMQGKQREIEAREREHQKDLAVLHSTLPKHIADRVARGEVVNDHYDSAAVLFLDIVGFTSISDRIPAGHVVHLLDQIFTALDALCEQHDVTKIKTIGDSYMAVAFEGNTSERIALCALDMLSTLNDMEIKMPAELGDTSWTKDVGDIRVRIGLHVGPVTAGVIGTQRMQYDVWGDTVNVASRMESSSEAGRIHVSEAFVINLKSNTEYRIQNSMIESDNAESLNSSLVTSHLTSHPSLLTSHFIDSSLLTPHSSLDFSLLTSHFSLQLRGSVDIKGKGKITTYWLV